MDFADYNAGDILWLGNWSTEWIGVLACLGIMVVALSVYDLRPLPRGRRWTLVSLRTAAYALAVLLLLEPAVDLKNVTKVRNEVVVLVDASRSMSLADEASDRWTAARQAVAELNLPPTLEDENHRYTLQLFHQGPEPTTAAELEAMKPSGPESNLSSALEALAQRNGRTELGGVVLVSDGIDTSSLGGRVRRDEQLDQATLDLLASLDAPVNAYVAGRREAVRDLAITRVGRDDFAFVHNKVSIEVELQAFGLDSASFPVTLSRDGQLLQTRQATVAAGSSRTTLTFEFVPKSIGKELYTVSVPEYPGEILTTNNTHHFLQTVIRDKVRALQVVGRPSWDERFLRRLLKRNPNVDLISFFILRTSQNPNTVSNDELSLIPFPTDELFNEELGSFDVVIFQNFDFEPYDMRQYLPRIAEFVKAGGGFAMVGGDLSFASGGYARTPMEEILPVGLPTGSGASLIDVGKFRPVLTEVGMRHPITQLAFDPSSNFALWERLPQQHGTNLVLGAKPGATVLATHPTLRAAGKPMPVVTVQEVGEGRSMAVTTDSTWRWAFESLGQGGTPREYHVFWNSAIRWLIQDPELKLLRVEVDGDEKTPGETAGIEVRVALPNYSPAVGAQARVTVVRRGFDSVAQPVDGADVVLSELVTTDGRGTARIELPVEAEGVYSVTATTDGPTGELTDSDTFLGVDAAAEFADIVPRDDLLERVARATGGHFAALPTSDISPRFHPPRTVKVNRRTVIHLWDSLAVFALILCLLGVEWTARRRWGRL